MKHHELHDSSQSRRTVPLVKPGMRTTFSKSLYLTAYQFKFCMHFWFRACVQRVSYPTHHEQALYEQIMLVEESVLWSSLPRNFLHPLVTVCSQFQIRFSSPRPQVCYTNYTNPVVSWYSWRSPDSNYDIRATDRRVKSIHQLGVTDCGKLALKLCKHCKYQKK
jgi:hypothetical protein